MGKSQIAPVLHVLAAHGVCASAPGVREKALQGQARRELRALLAEVRALRRYKKRHGIAFATGRGPDPEGQALLRAMERTDRLSRTSRKDNR